MYKIMSEDAMFNHEEHLTPLQYSITSYDMGNKATYVLQWWIKSTIYNDESSISRSSVTKHNTILCNLGYRDINLRSLSKSIVTSTTPTM